MQQKRINITDMDINYTVAGCQGSIQLSMLVALMIMIFHSEIDRNRQTEKDRHKHKHKKLYFLQHSTIEILHTCMYNTKTNQLMKIMKSTNTV